MAVTHYEKTNYDAVEMAGFDDPVTDAETGARTYAVTTDGASIEVRFRPPRENQTHTGLKAGSKVVIHKDGSVEIRQKK